MDISCSLVIAIFCFSTPIGSTSIKIENGFFDGSATIDAPDFHADLGLFTDTPNLLNPRKLNRACFDGRCISYWRQCDDGGHPTECEYVLAPDVREPGTKLKITGNSEAATKRAIENIGILDRASQMVWLTIPLSILNEETRYRDPGGPYQ